MTATTVSHHAFIPSTSLGSMDIKPEMIYRDDDVMLVKSEPQMFSPSNGVTNLLAASIPNSNNALATSSTISVSNGIIISNNGLVTAAVGGSFNTFGNGTGNTNSPVGVVPPQPNKRPRNDDFLSSPSPGAISVSAPPLTPSPGPPSQAYTVISNGYSSPMSSGSYDPYSPNGKIGETQFYIRLSHYKCIKIFSNISSISS